MALSKQEKEQVLIIIKNIDTKSKRIPYFSDLQKHAIYGTFFSDLESEQILEIYDIIEKYIHDKIQGFTTKGGEFFRRFYALNKNNFWKFRELNEQESNVESDEFQEIGTQLQQELFKFENMLTQNMGKRGYGLDKVVSSYYDIVHSFFPWFSFIK